MNSGLNNWNSLTKRVLLLFVTASYSGGHYICVLNTAHFSRASKKHQFSTKTTKTKTNSTFKSWKCCFYADFARGLYFNTRLNWKRAFRSKTACRASSPSAAGGRCSEARMAQRSKYGVTPPYFGHRKRGCEATSSPFVYLRQSCGDNYCFCFTAFLLAFLI